MAPALIVVVVFIVFIVFIVELFLVASSGCDATEEGDGQSNEEQFLANGTRASRAAASARTGLWHVLCVRVPKARRRMASRFLLSSLGWLCFCCGGRASVNAASGGMGGSSIMVGTSGSVGTGGGVGGSVAPRGIGGSWMMVGTSGSVGTGGSVGGSVAAGGAASSAGTGGIDWAACAPPDTCVLETETACGAGCEPVPLSRFILVNTKLDAAYKKQQVVPPCTFGSCEPVPPNMVNASNYYAECEAGRCVGLDVRTSPLSACSTDAECILRSGTSCCGCGAGDLIAVSSKANVQVAFCGTNGGCAADCVSAPVPPGVAPYCSLGHCLVKYTDPVSDGGAAR